MSLHHKKFGQVVFEFNTCKKYNLFVNEIFL